MSTSTLRVYAPVDHHPSVKLWIVYTSLGLVDIVRLDGMRESAKIAPESIYTMEKLELVIEVSSGVLFGKNNPLLAAKAGQ